MIYIDNSATTKPYPEVTDLMVKYMNEDFGNPSSLYQLGVDAEKAIKNARKQVMRAMGVTEGSVYFTSCGTEADNMALFGAARALRRAGNRIVTSCVEHPAILECCKRLEADGFDVVYIDVDDKCRLDEEQLERAINEDTILVTLMQVNNETGTIMPTNKVKQIMKAKGAPGLFHSDCVQSFGKLSLPTDADLISVSGHKIHGPKGIGALYIKSGVNLPAYIVGGGQESGKRSGTENVAAIVGFGLAAEMTSKDRNETMNVMTEIREAVIDGLNNNLNDIIINSPEEVGTTPGLGCASVLNVTFKNTRGEVILHTLEQDQIYLSTGSACSSNKSGQSHVLSAMGLRQKDITGALRISLGRFNSLDEVDEIVEKVTTAVNRFRKLGSFR